MESSKVETWASIDGLPLYSISDQGRIVHAVTGNELAAGIDKNGYRKVALRVGKRRVHILVHRVIAMAFLPDFEYGKRIGFHNGDSHDCRAENLYMTDKRCRTPDWIF